MANKKTLRKQKESSRPTRDIKLKKVVKEYDPFKDLLDEDLISRAIFECLKDNNPQGVIEVIEAHLMAANKVQRAKKAKLARSTLYHSLKGKNPTIATLAKLIHACV